MDLRFLRKYYKFAINQERSDIIMTRLLTKAIKEAEKLSPEIQNELAEQLLDDIRSEIQWQSTLSKPQEKLEKFARGALEHSQFGKTQKGGFDEL